MENIFITMYLLIILSLFSYPFCDEEFEKQSLTKLVKYNDYFHFFNFIESSPWNVFQERKLFNTNLITSI